MSEMRNTKVVIMAALDMSSLSDIGKISLLNEIIGDIKNRRSLTAVLGKYEEEE